MDALTQHAKLFEDELEKEQLEQQPFLMNSSK